LDLRGARLEDVSKVVAAYELYAAVELHFENGLASWSPFSPPVAPQGLSQGLYPLGPTQDRIKALEEELAALRASEVPNPLVPLTGPALASFRSSGKKPKWMNSMVEVFDTYLSDISESSASAAVEALWKLVTDIETSYRNTYGFSCVNIKNGTSAPPSSSHTKKPPFKARQCQWSLPEAQNKGARIQVEQTPAGPLSFAWLDGCKYFVATRSGVLWDVAFPPPGGCNRCGGTHWQWTCPKLSSTSFQQWP